MIELGFYIKDECLSSTIVEIVSIASISEKEMTFYIPLLWESTFVLWHNTTIVVVLLLSKSQIFVKLGLFVFPTEISNHTKYKGRIKTNRNLL